MNVLMLSSSRAEDEAYLQHAIPMFDAHLKQINELLFIPFAGVTLDWLDYTNKVQAALPNLQVKGIHQYRNALEALKDAKAIAVGGGNTFNLLNQLYQQDLFKALQDQVKNGVPYIGWSAGSNICGNSIRTTNDMPIVQPISFEALNFVPFQINPHYTDYHPPEHNGETRAQRIEEFCALNPNMPVIGIKEGTALLRQGNGLTLKGDLPGTLFLGTKQTAIQPEQDLSQYLLLQP